MIANGLARIGRDVELRYLPQGDAVANISLAFTYGRKDSEGKRPTQWVEGSIWGKRAEALSPYLLKGSLVSVTLEDVCIETFQGKNGEGHKLTGRVLAIDLVPNGSKQGDSAPRQAAPAQRPASAPAARTGGSSGFEDMQDDVPFTNPMRGAAKCLAM